MVTLASSSLMAQLTSYSSNQESSICRISSSSSTMRIRGFLSATPQIDQPLPASCTAPAVPSTYTRIGQMLSYPYVVNDDLIREVFDRISAYTRSHRIVVAPQHLQSSSPGGTSPSLLTALRPEMRITSRRYSFCWSKSPPPPYYQGGDDSKTF